MKHYSQAAKKKNKKNRKKLTGHELSPTIPSPRAGRPANESRREKLEDIPAIRYRERQTGIKDVAKLRAQMLETEAGMAISLIHEGQDALDIGAAWMTLSAALRRYMRYKTEKRIDAKCAKVEMMPEPFEVDTDHTPDLRTYEERHDAACRVWGDWQARMRQLPAGDQMALAPVLWGRAEGQLVRDQKPTPLGRAFVRALAALLEK